jgi:hypothetical protein
MEVTLAELLEGKATIIKNKDYLATKDYVQPFIDSMSKFTNDFRVKIKLPDQMTMGQTQDITYNRVLIEAVLPPDHCIDKHDEVIGFLYGLDTRKPLFKLYRGYLNQACTNLSVFDPKWIEVKEMQPGKSLEIDTKKMLELPNHFDAKLKHLKGTIISKEHLFDRLGGWIDTSLREYYHNGVQSVKISPNVPVEAYKSLYIDSGSPYFVPATKEASLFDVYNAFTQIITDDTKDIMNRFEKTMMVNKLLGL